MNVKDYVRSTIAASREASSCIAFASTQQKNDALEFLADYLTLDSENILQANLADMQLAKQTGLADVLLDRLELSDKVLQSMIASLHEVSRLQDPVGSITQMSTRPSGISVGNMRVPLGVVGVIYESRPNVTSETASLCIKSGNAAVLRGGSESVNSNNAIASCIAKALKKASLPAAVVSVINTKDRAAVSEILVSDNIDILMPRGGRGLIERVAQDAKMPVIKHLDGNCHVFVDGQVDIDEALAVIVNAKTHRYGVCNATESLLVHQDIYQDILPKVAEKFHALGVEMRGCRLTQDVIACSPATEDDWNAEYLAPIISIKVVKNIEEAINHINKYGSGHTDAILTKDYKNSMLFLKRVDSSSVIVNASTRFADGFEYGLGAEIGISTDKFHARGPVGLEGLTSQKWIVLGQGQIR